MRKIWEHAGRKRGYFIVVQVSVMKIRKYALLEWFYISQLKPPWVGKLCLLPAFDTRDKSIFSPNIKTCYIHSIAFKRGLKLENETKSTQTKYPPRKKRMFWEKHAGGEKSSCQRQQHIYSSHLSFKHSKIPHLSNDLTIIVHKHKSVAP